MRLKMAKPTLLMAAVLLAAMVVPIGAATDTAHDGPAAEVRAALAHLEGEHAAYGLGAEDVAELRVTSAYRSAHNGVTHVYLRQQVDGLDVAGADMTVNVRDGVVLHAGTRMLAGVAASASGRQALDAAAAVHAAARHLGLAAPRGLRVLESRRSGARETVMTGGGIAVGRIPARLVYQPTGGGGLRLAWNLELELPSAEHWWNVSIDAETGALLATTDYVAHDSAEEIGAAVAHPHGPSRALGGHGDAEDEALVHADGDGASYRVYALPLESPNDGPRTLVTNPADPLASPFGWHDTNGQEGPEYTVTTGNNVEAYIDTSNAHIVAPNALPGMQASGGDTLTFDHPVVDHRLPPTAYKDAAVTNLFYWNNIIHDVFYRYGFDEPAGNFQVNNYGRGGAGGDSVRAEAQDGSGTNNANFATPTDGSRPRMQMYIWTPPAGYVQANPTNAHLRDGDFDSGIIVHEYGHGISNRLTGGPDTGGCLGNQEQMGEGWSDWLAIALTAREGDTGEQLRGMGTYALYTPSRENKGIRPTAYSTNMSVNPATYDTIRTAAVPHGVGYVWSTMLWDVYWALVGEHGFNPDPYGEWSSGGNNLAIQLVMDGMKFQPCRPGFVDGRDAILAADEALTDGQNACTIWAAFARRGLGQSALQGNSNSRADGTQAFDVPEVCEE